MVAARYGNALFVIYRQASSRPGRSSTITISPRLCRRHRRRAAHSAGPRGTQGEPGLDEGGGARQAENKWWMEAQPSDSVPVDYNACDGPG